MQPQSRMKVRVPIPQWILREMEEKIAKHNPNINIDDLIAASVAAGIRELEEMNAEEIIKILESAGGGYGVARRGMEW